MTILVAIANHGHGNRQYLDQLLASYRGMPFDVDVVIVSNIPKDLGRDIEVRVGVPTDNPWSLPFAHRSLFVERQDDYDLFIYSEDDTLVTERNIRAFMQADNHLREDELAGFIRSEIGPDGTVYYSSVHSFFRWLPESVVRRGEQLFAQFSNEHAACYMLPRAKLKRAIASGGFDVPPHEGRHDMLCAAATDPYTQCGMQRLMCISQLEDFVLRHLPNKYIGRFGVTHAELMAQIESLKRIAAGDAKWRGQLCDPETKLRHSRWSKNLYPMRDDLLVRNIPHDAKSVLVIGSGWGVVEETLRTNGRDVAVVPVDALFAERVTERGLRLFERWRQDGERGAAEEFDCVAIVDTLHLTAQPEDLLKKALDYLKPLGTLLVLSPNIATVIQRWKAKSTGDDKIRAGFEHSGVHAFSPRRVRSLIRSVNGMRPEKFSSDFDYAPGRTGQLRVLPGMRSQAASRFALSVVKGGSQTPQ